MNICLLFSRRYVYVVASSLILLQASGFLNASHCASAIDSEGFSPAAPGFCRLHPCTLLTWGAVKKTHNVYPALPGKTLVVQENCFSKTLLECLTHTKCIDKILDFSQFPDDLVDYHRIDTRLGHHSLTLGIKWEFGLAGQKLTAVCGEFNLHTRKLHVHVWRDNHGGIYIAKTPLPLVYR